VQAAPASHPCAGIAAAEGTLSMARERKPPEKPDDVPAWFMTYSDVITLLMTFFILLLTFATNEPETFERMQVSMFGGSGATGVAGDSNRDALILRQRPRSARISMRGSETPPPKADPGMNALHSGLAGLDGPQPFSPADSYRIRLPLSALIVDGKVSREGSQLLRRTAARIRQGGLRATLRGDASRLDGLLAIADHLKEWGVPHFAVGIGTRPADQAPTLVQLELLQP
jgi:flagellar motor protein MotB